MPRTDKLLETETGKQEVPSLSNVIKLDLQRRGVFPHPFKAGDTLVVDVLGPNTILMHLFGLAAKVRPALILSDYLRDEVGLTQNRCLDLTTS